MPAPRPTVMVDATVHCIDRGRVIADVNHVVEGYVTGTDAEPNPDIVRGEGPVYNLVIDHPEATILWDTGSHPEAGDGYWPEDYYQEFTHYDADEHCLEDDLAEAGFGVEDIDCVLQTHLHLDHAGGLYHFDGTDVPIYVHEEELKHAYYSARTDAGDDAYLATDFHHDLNWQVLRRERETRFEDVAFIHLPGHTPGLVGTVLHLDEGTVIFAGDQVYTRANYYGEYALGAGLLWSRPHWRESLDWLTELERRYGATVYCGHDPDDFEELRGGLP